MTAEEHLRISFGNDSLLPPIGDEIGSGLYPNSRQRTRIYKAMESYATDRLDSYKKSLRSAIAVTNSPNGDDYFMDGYEQGLLKAMELIDTVTPKE